MIHRICFARLLAFFALLTLASSPAVAQSDRSLSDFPRVKPAELKTMIEDKVSDILVVSNDPQESFDEAHIPGAVSFPWVNTLKPPVNLPRNKTLILYCACAHEEDSTDMAAKLAKFGYRNLKVLDGGILKWMELKYPLEKK
jgi:rhodanese-related sulfurtransferase